MRLVCTFDGEWYNNTVRNAAGPKRGEIVTPMGEVTQNDMKYYQLFEYMIIGPDGQIQGYYSEYFIPIIETPEEVIEAVEELVK